MMETDTELPILGSINRKIEHTASMIVEGLSSHDLIGELFRLHAVGISKSTDEDMFGNTSLHQAFASGIPNIALIKDALQKSPAGAKVRNQCGRIPLHYALDRPKVDFECFLLLLKAYPEGASEEDDLSCTPYDLSLRWQHSNVILKALLATDPSQDKKSYMKLRWGPISPIVTYLSDPSLYRRKSRFSPKSGMIAVDDGCTPDKYNTDKKSLMEVDENNNVLRTRESSGKVDDDEGIGEVGVREDEVGVGGSGDGGEGEEADVDVDVEAFEALDPSESGGSDKSENFSNTHVRKQSNVDEKNESKANPQKNERLDILEDIVSTDIYDVYNTNDMATLWSAKI